MSMIMDRINKRGLPEPTELRDKILDAVEELIDRAEQVVEDAPNATDAIERVRPRRALRVAGTTIVAVAPTLVRGAKHRFSRRGAKGVMAAAPVVVVRSHPVLAGIGLVTTVAATAYAVKRLRARRAEDREDHRLEAAHDAYVKDVDPTRFDLEEEVMRMEDEGGEPSAGSADAVSARSRRFVRQGNGQRAARS